MKSQTRFQLDFTNSKLNKSLKEMQNDRAPGLDEMIE